MRQLKAEIWAAIDVLRRDDLLAVVMLRELMQERQGQGGRVSLADAMDADHAQKDLDEVSAPEGLVQRMKGIRQ